MATIYVIRTVGPILILQPGGATTVPIPNLHMYVRDGQADLTTVGGSATLHVISGNAEINVRGQESDLQQY